MSEHERIARAVVQLLGSRGWLLIWDDGGHLKSCSPLPVHLQKLLAETVAESFAQGGAEERFALPIDPKAQP